MRSDVVESPLVSVVVATYNGAQFLREQLDSILAQTVREIEIVINDDCSTDDTARILASYAGESRVRWSRNETRAGALRNFSVAAGKAKGAHVAFSDQDDIWLPHKLERSLAAIREVERGIPAGTPVMVYTDVHVVTSDATIIEPSYYGFYRRNPRANRFSRTLCQCVALGCTILANRPLVDLALPVPDGAAMHDSWFGLVASAFGSIHYVDEATLLWRQHSRNTSGGISKTPLYTRLLRAVRGMTDNERYRASLYRRCREGEAFMERFHGKMSPELRDVVSAFCRVPRSGPLERRLTLAKYGFFKSSLLDNLEMFVRV